MAPTLGPTSPVPTLPLGAFASYHSPSASAPEPSAPQGVRTEGLRHAENIVLDARHYKERTFAKQVLQLLATLQIRSWGPSGALTPATLHIHKVSGSLTNAVFFISHAGARTVLLRIYGPSSSLLVSRPHELHTLHVLSSRYGIGPGVYGTFVNGRVEEYFESEALTCAEMRDPQVSAWIAMRMAELHCVALETVAPGEEREGVRRNVRRWLEPAREVVRLAQEKGHRGAAGLDLDGFARRWDEYWAWLMRWELTHGPSERVFAHNDTQYGNLLRLREPRAGQAAHHKIIVVDFEYASPNAAAFDIANHFHEWTADYHSAQPHQLRRDRYPASLARRNFYLAYLTEARRSGNARLVPGASRSAPSARGTLLVPTGHEVAQLDAAVRAWSAASHAMWAVWGLVQAREDVERGDEGEFDYVAYARGRLDMFSEEATALM